MDKFTLESQVLTYEKAGFLSDGELVFEGVTLAVKVGEHEAGTKFHGAYLSTSTALLGLENDKGEREFYKVNLTIGEKVDLTKYEAEIKAATPPCTDKSCPCRDKEQSKSGLVIN